MKHHISLLIISLLVYGCINIKANVSPSSVSQSQTENAQNLADIKRVLNAQETAWNNGDLEGFMQGYWQSDSLKFYGKNGLTKGWQKTLNNYQKNYPTKTEKGVLKFEIDDISKIDNENYWVMGQYFLTRDAGDANGVFMLIFKNINGSWKIVADMSC